jgi:hypothetical protein
MREIKPARETQTHTENQGKNLERDGETVDSAEGGRMKRRK